MSRKTDLPADTAQNLDAPITLTPDQIEQVAGAALDIIDLSVPVWMKFGTPVEFRADVRDLDRLGPIKQLQLPGG
jgi:hypothetical protein